MEQHSVTNSFMGIVILPLFSNDPTTIAIAYVDKMDISIALTLERCMQTALMIVPLVVLVAWCMGIDAMSMKFNSFSVASLFVSIIIVTHVVQGGRCKW
jgi:Ca2+:H+ antiporter